MRGDVYMKDKIVLFVIGVLVGAIIATGSFYVYTIANSNCNSKEIYQKCINGVDTFLTK